MENNQLLMKIKTKIKNFLYCINPYEKNPTQLSLMFSSFLTICLGFLSVSLTFFSIRGWGGNMPVYQKLYWPKTGGKLYIKTFFFIAWLQVTSS